ncbi:hypothetical protein [Rhizobium phage RHEph15]|nr:hypothetical protein [Rhizobium phage RHEph15]
MLHKVGGKYAKSSFSFDGLVDRRRVKREIIKAFKRGGETVSPLYIDASIDVSLKLTEYTADQYVHPVQLADIATAEEAHASETTD